MAGDIVQIADVAVAAPLDKTLSYRVPDELRQAITPGLRVRVPLGRRSATGYVLSLADGSPEGLKPVAEILDRDPLFDPAWARFVQKAAAYYRFPPGEAFRTALPAGLSGKGNDVTILTEKIYSAGTEPGEPAGAKQKEVLAAVRSAGELTLSELRLRFEAPHPVLNRLVELGFLAVHEAERQRDPFQDQPIADDSDLTLGPDQQAALEALEAELAEERFAAALLHGVTGSGKTEVYLRLIASVLAAGRQALILVPEISLTPQLVSRFRARFARDGVTIAVLHSGLSDGERYDAWRSIARGDVSIVIGARSAIFAPLPNLGAIVVDEEHETSYKQSEGFRYHARDLALLRGQDESALVLLGSATPSLPVYKKAKQGDLLYLPLTGRVGNRPMPRVEMLDMREEGMAAPLSEPLLKALQQNFEQGGQSLLLLNRRGFAPYLICADCGFGARCPKCELTLTYREALREALREAMHSDERVFLMGEDVGRYGGCFAVSKGLLEEFGPERIRDTPLSESSFVGAGIGAALGGMRPIVEVMTVNFSLLALDQILNNAATYLHMSGGLLNVPLVIRMATGGGKQLAAQHSHSLEGWYAHIPGIKVLVPATLEDARGMLWTALEDPDPVLLFEPSVFYPMEGELAADAGPVDIDQAKVRREGRDVSVITYGGCLFKALDAAEKLAEEGIEVEVIDLRTLRPLDDKTFLASVAKTHRALIVDEGWRSGSISAEICARIMEQAFYELDAPVERICSAEVPMPYAKHMEDAALPQAETIVSTARRMVHG